MELIITNYCHRSKDSNQNLFMEIDLILAYFAKDKIEGMGQMSQDQQGTVNCKKAVIKANYLQVSCRYKGCLFNMPTINYSK